MYCKFLTYKDCDNISLASFSRSKAITHQPDNTICLATCHRIEYYSCKPFEVIHAAIQPAKQWNEIEGMLNVLTRLATIAAGCDSKILGEQFIAMQCLRPFLRTSVSDFPFKLVDKAFEIASKVKSRYCFNSSFSYDNAAFKLLGMRREEAPSILLVIGGGLLGQHIASNDFASGYSRVIVVTNMLERCSEDIRAKGDFTNIQVTNLQSILTTIPFDCIIATNPQSDYYIKKILKVINNAYLRSIVDFCSIPIANQSVFKNQEYHTMYSNSFLSLVRSANTQLESILPHVKEEISRTIEQTLIDTNE